MNSLVTIADRIPAHIKRGHIVSAVQDGQVLDIKRCWSSVGTQPVVRSMGDSFPNAEIVCTTVPEVLDFCADYSLVF